MSRFNWMKFESASNAAAARTPDTIRAAPARDEATTTSTYRWPTCSPNQKSSPSSTASGWTAGASLSTAGRGARARPVHRHRRTSMGRSIATSTPGACAISTRPAQRGITLMPLSTPTALEWLTDRIAETAASPTGHQDGVVDSSVAKRNTRTAQHGSRCREGRLGPTAHPPVLEPTTRRHQIADPRPNDDLLGLEPRHPYTADMVTKTGFRLAAHPGRRVCGIGGVHVGQRRRPGDGVVPRPRSVAGQTAAADKVLRLKSVPISLALPWGVNISDWSDTFRCRPRSSSKYRSRSRSPMTTRRCTTRSWPACKPAWTGWPPNVDSR